MKADRERALTVPARVDKISRNAMAIRFDGNLGKIAPRESRIVFEYFDAKIAWTLGCDLKALPEHLGHRPGKLAPEEPA